jgi:hypothetical protein
MSIDVGNVLDDDWATSGHGYAAMDNEGFPGAAADHRGDLHCPENLNAALVH